MQIQQRATDVIRSTAWTAALLSSTLLLLTACGGGASSGSGSSGSAGVDPLVEDLGIAYVRQVLPEMDTADVRDPADFTPGGDLIFRDLASPSSSERNITAELTGGLGDVKDVEVSFDGRKLLFALHMPEIEGAAPEDQPTWNIWEYDIDAKSLTRIIESDITAEAGQDLAPHYLPDERIIFSSTRQRSSRALLLDEGKPQFPALDEDRDEPALLLHVMNKDGSDIQQVSFNQSHDMDPMVLESGEVVFSRWDNMGSRNAINLYRMNPDGTRLQLLYGAKSHDTGVDGSEVQFLQPRQMPDGSIAVLAKPFTGNFQGADIVDINIENYVENLQPVAANAGISEGPAQSSVAFNEVRTDLLPSPGGRFSSFYPLRDGTDRALISWSPCRLMQGTHIVPCSENGLADPEAIEAPPLYSVYMYDMGQQILNPMFIPEEGIVYRDVVAAQPRLLPAIIFDQADAPGADFDTSLIDEGVGILNIRSVYDFDGQFNSLGGDAANIAAMADPARTRAADRPARFLRIVKAVSIPDRDIVELNGNDFGRSSGQLMREIIGYAPIEPDGSVRVQIPANIPFAISVLDKDGRRITGRHQNWLQLRPGEIINCSGCHDAGSDNSHGRRDAFVPLYDGAAVDSMDFPNTNGFPANTGETMAEARTRIDPTALKPDIDIRYQDVWTDDRPAGAALTKDAPLTYSYTDIAAALPPESSWEPPVTRTSCLTKWNNLCRIVINYEAHIHPLWKDNGCTGCHTLTAADDSDMVPDGQLDLTDGVDATSEQFTAYRELLFGDFELIIDEITGNLVIREEQLLDSGGRPVFETDIDGNFLRDVDGNRIPVMRRFPVPSSMSTAGALASSRFFARFADPGDADHFEALDPAELKLIAEWLDIGGQYYNNPFDVPE